jgi:hypoxanthine-DNA glycosylase
MSFYSHPFAPVFDEYSKILILGTFPSPKSREYGFYYGNPQNRFWKVLAFITKNSLPETVAEKKKMLLEQNIALYDVIEYCEIEGAKDSSITNIKPSDLSDILSGANIKKIYANGAKAFSLYKKYQYPKININITKLTSTSPANATYNLQKLIQYWKCITENL